MPKQGDSSAVIGVTRFAEIAGKSRWWASAKLEEWLKEQENGGPHRVNVSSGPSRRGRQPRRILTTTLAVIQQEFVGIHDPVVMRKLRDHDKAIDFLTKQVMFLLDENRRLREQRAS